MKGGHGQKLVAVAGVPRHHGLEVTLPMPLALLLRDDQIQVLAQRLVRREAEHPGGTVVPQSDDPVRVGHHDGLGGFFDDADGESLLGHRGLCRTGFGHRAASFANRPYSVGWTSTQHVVSIRNNEYCIQSGRRAPVLLRQLEYFVAVARERHFARAAESCYVSQPALSTSIAKLERELSVTLIHRGQNFEGLTPEGERIVVWAKRLLAEHDGLKAEAAAMRAGISGTLRLGTGPTVSTTTALPVAAFCALHPLAKVTICSRLSSTELLRQLRDFELDAAIAHFGPDDQSGLEVVPLYRERYVLLVSGEQILPGARTITW